MCDKCNDLDGQFRCEDCGRLICFKPAELTITEARQAVVFEGDYLCEQCVPTAKWANENYPDETSKLKRDKAALAKDLSVEPEDLKAEGLD
jgi:hypothetical protein